MPKIMFSSNEIKRLSQGQRLSEPKLEMPQNFGQDGIYRAESEGKICGLVKKQGIILSPEFIWKV